jgi:hypothetical protein
LFEFGELLLISTRVAARGAVVFHLSDMIVEAVHLILKGLDLLAVGGDGVAQVLFVALLLVILRDSASAQGYRANQHQRQHEAEGATPGATAPIQAA